MQVRAAMLFNGHTQDSINEIDETTFNTISVMYNNGILGNMALLNVLGSLTAGVFNYIRPPNAPAYGLKTILNEAYGYLYQDAEITPQDSLKLFMTQAQGFNMDLFKGK